MSRDTFTFLPQHVGFAMNLKKLVLTPSQQIELLGLKQIPHHDFGNNRAKDGKGNFEMSESPFSPSNHWFGINRIDRFDVLNCPNSSASSPTATLFTTSANIITKPGLFIPDRYSIKQSVKTVTTLVGGKLKVKQWHITKAKGTKFSDTNRSIKIRLGNIL